MGLLPLEGVSVGFGVSLQPASTGHRQLNLRQEAWARSSVRGHRECLRPWSKSYPEGTESPRRREDIPKRKVVIVWHHSGTLGGSFCSREACLHGHLFVKDQTVQFTWTQAYQTYDLRRGLFWHTHMTARTHLYPCRVEVPWLDARFCTASAGTVGSLWWCVISVRKEELTLTFEAQRAWNNNSVKPSYHPHFGEVDQALLREIGRSLLDEGQVCQIHPQIRHTRRVAAVKGVGGAKFKERARAQIDNVWLGVIYFFRVSLRFLKRPSEDTVFCSLSIKALVWTRPQRHS